MTGRAICVVVGICLSSQISVAADCGDVLKLTGRNFLTSVSLKDRQAYFYRNVCSASDTGFDGNYKDLESSFGFNYSSKEEFCQSEKSRFSSYDYDYISTSTVVDKALTVFADCKKLEDKRVKLELSISPEHVGVDISRSGTTTGIIYGWRISEGNSCKIVTKGTEETKASQYITNLNLSLPVSELVTLSCARSPIKSSADSASEYYPAVNVAVFTSEGHITFPIPADARASETWASDIEAKLKKYDSLISNHDKLILSLESKKVSNVQLPLASSWAHKWNGMHDCPAGQVVTSVGVQGSSGAAAAVEIKCSLLQVDRK